MWRVRIGRPKLHNPKPPSPSFKPMLGLSTQRGGGEEGAAAAAKRSGGGAVGGTWRCDGGAFRGVARWWHVVGVSVVRFGVGGCLEVRGVVRLVWCVVEDAAGRCMMEARCMTTG